MRAARDTFRRLPASVQARHRKAWAALERAILAKFGVPKAKVYEVHHAVEHGRTVYLGAVAAGFPPSACLLKARKAFKPAL